MVPKFLSSLELILPRSDSPFKWEHTPTDCYNVLVLNPFNAHFRSGVCITSLHHSHVFTPRCIVDIRELRHASIRLLLSMLSLPLHFLYQPLPGELASAVWKFLWFCGNFIMHFGIHHLPTLDYLPPSLPPSLPPQISVPSLPPTLTPVSPQKSFIRRLSPPSPFSHWGTVSWSYCLMP